jgi:hypothetical protein
MYYNDNNSTYFKTPSSLKSCSLLLVHSGSIILTNSNVAIHNYWINNRTWTWMKRILNTDQWLQWPVQVGGNFSCNFTELEYGPTSGIFSSHQQALALDCFSSTSAEMEHGPNFPYSRTCLTILPYYFHNSLSHHSDLSAGAFAIKRQTANGYLVLARNLPTSAGILLHGDDCIQNRQDDPVWVGYSRPGTYT